ncbi:MAG: hypothetical protein Tsb005_14160 [Gammaproteobacteria bacterium]
MAIGIYTFIVGATGTITLSLLRTITKQELLYITLLYFYQEFLFRAFQYAPTKVVFVVLYLTIIFRAY